MEELTKGEIKRRQKWDKYNQNIIEQFAEYGLEARLIDKDDQKHLTKIEKWRYIMRVYQQRYGQKINNIRTLNNDMLRSWMYAGVFGESRYGQGLLDFTNDCEEYDTLYVISGLTVKDAYIKIEIKNAEKFCRTIIYQKTLSTGRQGEHRLKIDELSGYFLYNAKKNKVLYYEVDMGTQTWYFGI